MLGIREVSILSYPDGAVDQMDPAIAIRQSSGTSGAFAPMWLSRFGPEGGYGHPDHIAISQFTTAAAVCASDAGYLLDAQKVTRFLVTALPNSTIWRGGMKSGQPTKPLSAS